MSRPLNADISDPSLNELVSLEATCETLKTALNHSEIYSTNFIFEIIHLLSFFRNKKAENIYGFSICGGMCQPLAFQMGKERIC